MLLIGGIEDIVTQSKIWKLHGYGETGEWSELGTSLKAAVFSGSAIKMGGMIFLYPGYHEPGQFQLGNIQRIDLAPGETEIKSVAIIGSISPSNFYLPIILATEYTCEQ